MLRYVITTLDNDDSLLVTSPFLGSSSTKKRSKLRTIRKTCLGILIFLTLTGLSLSLTAIYLPSWQVVYFAEYMHDHGREHAMHEHGLWQDCNRNVRKEIDALGTHETILTGPSQCLYKWDYEAVGNRVDPYEPSVDGETHRHHFYGWQIATLAFLGTALLSAITSSFLICCACLHRSVTFTLTASSLLTLALSAAGIVIFFFYAHRAENRFISSAVLTHEQILGDAFYLELGAVGVHLLAFIVSLLILLATLRDKPAKNVVTSKDDQELLSISQVSKSTGPNILRTLEVDPPLLYHQTTGTTLSQSTPHYIKHHSNTYRSPAASMPELPSRIYRCGSETRV
ncbi:unnamed protein product [Enterobius vermicularis]|uniref:Transmembrane protein n=1 Tax=Enterobius vermicularis TaxID=51028 RepID=A0A0N4VN29_ENTVE|nr:unnamed protein product [Enterobius vermicularis]